MAIDFSSSIEYVKNKYGSTTSTPSASTPNASTSNANTGNASTPPRTKRKNVLARFWDKLVSIITKGVLNIRSIDTKTKSKIKDAKTKTISKK